MNPRCPLCNEPTPSEDFMLPAIVLGSDPAAPIPMCPACGALSPEERHRVRDHAMARMLNEGEDI